jgi:hypothetical protein
MRLLITGDRNWRDAGRVFEALHVFLDRFGREHEGGYTLISGDARGADTYADVCGQLLGFTIERYPANWDEHGRAAGPIRNKQMLDSGVDYCIAFHDDLGASRGTRDMVEKVERAGIPLTIVGNDTRNVCPECGESLTDSYGPDWCLTHLNR